MTVCVCLCVCVYLSVCVCLCVCVCLGFSVPKSNLMASAIDRTGSSAKICKFGAVSPERSLLKWIDILFNARLCELLHCSMSTHSGAFAQKSRAWLNRCSAIRGGGVLVAFHPLAFSLFRVVGLGALICRRLAAHREVSV